MPLYDFKCQRGHTFERQVPLAQFEETQYCACGLPSARVISTPRFSVDNVDYRCPITGVHIGSQREHRENLARHDCRVLETGERELNQKRKRELDEAEDRRIDEHVEREFEAMPSAKKEKLANELLSGMDIAVERGTV